MMAELAVSGALALADEVLSFLDQEVNLQKNVRNNVEKIRSWLDTLQAAFKVMDGREGSEMLKTRVSQVRDLAYDIEDVLDELKLHMPRRFHRHRLSKYAESVGHHFKHRRPLHKLSSDVQDIIRRMNDIITLDHLREYSAGEGSSSGASVELYHQTPKEDEMVGFEGDKETLINHLVGDSRSALKKIWVVGLGGSGKTILVKNVYESKNVLKQYHCRAWIHVSRSCKINEILQSMLKQFRKGREKSNLTDEDVRARLRDRLEHRRYLLVLDDIWSKDDWECIVNALPQGSRGSGIITTSRNINEAQSCGATSPNILELKGLEWKQAYHLFCKKAFPGKKGCCPRELEELSENIVKKCEGLPLAIAAIGSLLSTKRQTPAEWKTLLDSLGSEIGPDCGLAIISRRFSDYSIGRGRLIRLWIVEGFIKERSGKTLEAVAEDYLNELVGRNLVEVTKWDFDGRVSCCRVRNLIKNFIISKSDEQKFVKILAESHSSSSVDYKMRRLSIQHSKTGWSDMSDLCYVRSLFMFEWDDSFHSKIRKFLSHLRLVKSLDLQGAPLTEFPEEIVELTLLRYLSLRGAKVSTVPKSIKKLAYLETLDLKHTRKTVTVDSAKGVEVPAGVRALSAIQKLSLIKVGKSKNIIVELKFLVQLRKLGLIGLERKDGRALCASIQEMQKLSTLDVTSSYKEEYLELDDMNNPPRHLQRLYLKGRLHSFPAWVSCLDSLVRSYLRWSRLETSPIEALQDLPNLVELEMLDAYTGEGLEFKAATFMKLKILHLEQLEKLNMVIVEANAMPKLEKLTICKCEKMEMLPLDISYLTQLRELLPYDMHENFIATPQTNSEYYYMIEHIPVIHYHNLLQ